MRRGVEQKMLFDIPPSYDDYWTGLPDYTHNDLEASKSIVVNFDDSAARKEFGRIIGQSITPNTKSIWFPPAEIGRFANKCYRSDSPRNPRYPVYIISKTRWDTRLTSKSLELLGIPYSIVVEPQEFDEYAAVIDPAKILTLPFSNLGQGSIPARNWVWEHAQLTGVSRHWILDDNIDGFFRFQNNLKCPVGDGTIFSIAEDFADRYTNVVLAGFNYFMFVPRKCATIPPVTWNTRIYSCILIQNDLDLRWRGRYNEDTDLSLRALKAGFCTALFNAFLCGKQTTMSMRGGNSDELYQDNGRLVMAQSLQEQHPDVVRVTTKWGRPQHCVNYRPFRKNKPTLRPDFAPVDIINNYGLTLEAR